MKQLLRIALLAALGAALTSATLAAALVEELTPARYFECQVAAQEATVVGVEERARTINNAAISAEQKRSSAQAAQDRVTLALYSCGRQNGATMGAYAHRHADALQAWLNANPQVKARMDALIQRLVKLSGQMTPQMPSPMPAVTTAPAKP